MRLPADLLPSRAHRRFLRQLQPVRPTRDAEYSPLTRLVLAHPLRSVLERHLATAGQVRGGILLGFQDDETLQVTHLLPSGYPPYLADRDPLALDGSYVLGAVDAARLTAPGPLDWVGSWVMPGEGLIPTLEWSLHVFERARRHALVSPDLPLLIFGRGEETTTLQAFVSELGSASAIPLPVSWAVQLEGHQ